MDLPGKLPQAPPNSAERLAEQTQHPYLSAKIHNLHTPMLQLLVIHALQRYRHSSIDGVVDFREAIFDRRA